MFTINFEELLNMFARAEAVGNKKRNKKRKSKNSHGKVNLNRKGEIKMYEYTCEKCGREWWSYSAENETCDCKDFKKFKEKYGFHLTLT